MFNILTPNLPGFLWWLGMMGFGDGEVGLLGEFLTGLVTLFGGDCTSQDSNSLCRVWS